MADGTKIEWTDATWNVINGCSVHSPGCTNCYAMKLAGTRLRDHPSRAGLTKMTKAGPVWTGDVRFNEKVLKDPLRWRKPRRIFVCAHGDLFHESVPDEWIDRVYAVMALCPQHTFQVLTKRSDRMRKYMTSLMRAAEVCPKAILTIPQLGRDVMVANATWPLPNVWLGVSAEDQARWDDRVADLEATPAAIRWVSIEPMLGPIDATYVCNGRWFFNPLTGSRWHDAPDGHGSRDQGANKIDWVVCGGESGPGARPMHPDWARSLRDQCAAVGVPFFFKQWGAFRPRENEDWGFQGEEATVLPDGRVRQWQPHYPRARLVHPQMRPMIRVGKKLAGRTLDGQIHDEFPEVAHG